MRRLEIPIHKNIYAGMTMEELSETHKQDFIWLSRTKLWKKLKTKKNALESYVYDMCNKLVDPIENRYRDEDAKAQATIDLLKCIEDFRMAMDPLPHKDKKLIDIECTKAEQWLIERSQQEESLPKNIDPMLWSREIRKKVEELDSI